MAQMERAAVGLGLDSLRRAVRGRKLALMMNQSALTPAGANLIDVMHSDWHAEIAFLLGMEHGVRGELQGGVKVKSQADPVTGLPVVSLYDYPGLRPPVETVATVDAIAFCAQDAGIRHYTYTPWMMFAMDAAAKAGTAMIVVDRPNPIGGRIVEGGTVMPEHFSIIGGFAYAYRHGMTVGELARMYNEVYRVGCDLTVVPMTGWTRDLWYDQTGLLWTPPSPNIPVPDTLMAYGTVGLLQSTNVSTGIGTTTPFHVFGAPWIDGRSLAAQINALHIPGLLCIDRYFLPNYSMYQGEVCSGVMLLVLDRLQYRPVTAAVHILALLVRNYGEHFRFTSVRSYDNRAGSPALRQDLLAGRRPEDILADWDAQARQFEIARRPYLLYE